MNILYLYKESIDSYRERDFWDWWFDYRWLVIIFTLVTLVIIICFFKHLTRLHTITLYVSGNTTTVQIQHGKTFSAPIPEGNGIFKGWYRDSACMIPFNSSDKIVSDFSLYSKFE